MKIILGYQTWVKDVQRKHRRQCLRLMQKLGIDTTDWTRINAFCQDQRIAGVFSLLSNEEVEQAVKDIIEENLAEYFGHESKLK